MCSSSTSYYQHNFFSRQQKFVVCRALSGLLELALSLCVFHTMDRGMFHLGPCPAQPITLSCLHKAAFELLPQRIRNSSSVPCPCLLPVILIFHPYLERARVIRFKSSLRWLQESLIGKYLENDFHVSLVIWRLSVHQYWMCICTVARRLVNYI